MAQISKRANSSTSTTPAQQPSTKRSNKRQASSSPAHGRQNQKTKPINPEDQSSGIDISVTAPESLYSPDSEPSPTFFPIEDGTAPPGFSMLSSYSGDLSYWQWQLRKDDPFALTTPVPSMGFSSATYSSGGQDFPPPATLPTLAVPDNNEDALWGLADNGRVSEYPDLPSYNMDEEENLLLEEWYNKAWSG